VNVHVEAAVGVPLVTTVTASVPALVRFAAFGATSDVALT
jgi:hypothetical protein